MKLLRVAPAALLAVGLLAFSEGGRHDLGASDSVGPLTNTAASDDVGFSDSFQRPDQTLNNTRTETGNRLYRIPTRPGRASLVIRNQQLSVTDPSAYGPPNSPILTVVNPQPATTLSVTGVFTAGTTYGNQMVIGATDKGFAISSVQLGLWARKWHVFYTQKRTDSAGTEIITIAGGRTTFPADGLTAATASMSLDRDNSCVDVAVPGVQQRVCDPVILTHWGTNTGVQILRPSASDGNLVITHIEGH